MAAISSSIQSGPFVGNGVLTAFAFTFNIAGASEIQVKLNGSIVASGLYSVALNADGTGTVNFNSAPASGASVMLYAAPDFQQDSQYENEGAYSLKSVNKINRRQVIKDNYLAQKVISTTQRALMVPEGEFALPVDSLLAADGMVLGVVAQRIKPVANDPVSTANSAASARASAGAAAASAAAAKTSADAALAAQLGLTGLMKLEMDAASGGAAWIVDKQYLWQDTAKTVPVAAPGDPIGCWQAYIGGAGWDAIQATNSNRPVYRVTCGVPWIDCGNGKGLYSRNNQTLSLAPAAYLIAGLRSNTNGNARFGFLKSDGSIFYLAPDGFARQAAWTFAAAPLNRAYAIAYSEIYSAPYSVASVVDSVLRAGQLDVKVMGGEADPPYSPATNTWAATDTVANMTIGFNCSGQSAGIGVSNLSSSTAIFGGAMVLVGAEPQKRQALITALEKSMTPVARAEDKVILCIGDSSSDDVNTTTSEYGAEIYRRFAMLLARDDPSANVFYRKTSFKGAFLCGYEHVQIGTSSKRIYVENRSISGSQPSYFFGDKFDMAYKSMHHVDRLISKHGGNMGVSVNDPNGYLRVGEYVAWGDRMRETFPNVPHFEARIYPFRLPAGAPAAPYGGVTPVVAAFDRYRNLYSPVDIGTWDAYQGFIDGGMTASWFHGDNAHLTQPPEGTVDYTDLTYGVNKELSIFYPAWLSWDAALPAVIAPPLMRTGTNILTASDWGDTDGTLGAGWTSSGPATIGRSTVRVEAGSAASLRMRHTGANTSYINKSFDPTPYRGLVLHFAVRMWIEPGQDYTVGRLQARTNGTNAVDGSSWIGDVGSKVTGGWFWSEIQLPVPADATTLDFRIYTGAGGPGDVHLNRATCGVARPVFR